MPLLTISGTARLGELGNPWFFRFFPSDATVKVAHARYVVEKLGAKRPAVIYQSTAYGQSGREQLAKTLPSSRRRRCSRKASRPPSATSRPPLLRAKNANADVIVLHLHAASTVLAVRQARQLLPDLPIVAGSAMHQPATAALARARRAERRLRGDRGIADLGHDRPDARLPRTPIAPPTRAIPTPSAAAQFDAVGMLGKVITDLRKAGQPVTPTAVRDRLASDTYQGVVTTYRSDGKGNMAHEAEIVCYTTAPTEFPSPPRYPLPPRS